jgi:hypothetical protein
MAAGQFPKPICLDGRVLFNDETDGTKIKHSRLPWPGAVLRRALEVAVRKFFTCIERHSHHNPAPLRYGSLGGVPSGLMGSFKQPQQVFSPEELRTLDLAFAGALARAKELGLPCAGLTGALRRRLFDVASTGITDLEALREEALKEMNIHRIAN